MKGFFLKRLINDSKDNILDINIPFGLFQDDNEDGKERRMVVFLGDNFADLPGTDLKEAYRITNLCLDYVRHQCSGYELYYKPHPKLVERDESQFLNLSGFKIESSIVAELFYIKNIKKIKYVFGACSMGSVTAYNMGLNSYTFTNIVGKSFDPVTFDGKKKAMSNMPEVFFINDFRQTLVENRKKYGGHSIMEGNLRKIFSQKNGKMWFVLGGTADLANAIAISTLSKKIDPNRKNNLIVVNHHRWKVVPLGDLKLFFENIYFVPRVFYSLRPNKIIKAIRAALEIKKFDIRPEDIILSIPGLGFADDCFASFFKQSINVAIIGSDVFEISTGEQNYSNKMFRGRLGARFFNLFLEPLLGIERTVWLEDKRRIFNVDRYSRPMNDIFDYIWKF